MARFEDFYRSLPDSEIERGEYFEKIFVPWFLARDAVWKGKVKNLWKWNDFPERWGPDAGIDIVFEDTESRYWAVQCKCISPDRQIPKKEIDSFLSESNDSRFYSRLLIATTDGLSKQAQQVIKRQEKPVVCFLRQNFIESGLEYPQSPSDISSRVEATNFANPRDYQLDAIEKVSEGFNTQSRGQLLMACGTGKTLTSYWISEKIKARRTLVLLPSLSLVSQTVRSWNEATPKKLRWIAICSDKTVGKKNDEYDEWVSNVSEIGVPVSNDQEEIKKFLLASDEYIVFCTYQSSQLVVDALGNKDINDFDLTIADEAHKCAGRTGDDYRNVINEEKIRSKKRLFMTATPRIVSRQLKRIASDAEYSVTSMDDTKIFGEVFYDYNFSDAIKDKVLSDYKILITGVNDEVIREKISNREIVRDLDSNIETDLETLASHVTISKAINKYKLEKIITFHNRVEKAKEFALNHPELESRERENCAENKIKADYISGSMSALERNKKISNLESIRPNQVSILANARCLTEGVNVPTLDAIAFIEPRRSQIDIVQAVGRVIRKHQTKDQGYIIIPVYLGNLSCLEEQLETSNYQNIWNVVLALKDQDDSLAETLDGIRIQLGQKQNRTNILRGFEKIVIDLPTGIPENIYNSIQLALIEKTTENWNEMYGQLLAFAEENGHSSPATKVGGALGSWVSTQRTFYRQNLISKKRIDFLEKLPKWTWNIQESKWHRFFNQLIEYVKVHGNADPPIDQQLGVWCRTQRVKYSKGKLLDEYISLLNSIDGWVWSVLDKAWEDKFNELVEFTNKNGHARPTPSHPTLGQWITTQRKVYKKGQLDKSRIERLEALNGWTWDATEFRWEENYLKLQEFVEINGHARPSKRDNEIGGWVVKNRSSYAKGKLSKERIEKLEALEGWVWNIDEFEWNKKFEAIVSGIEQGEMLSEILRSSKELNIWAQSQRRACKAGNLSQERIQKLTDVNGWVWDPFEEQWQMMYKELRLYVSRFGHTLPSKQTHRQLSEWVVTQRSKFRKNQLTAERIKKLEMIDSWIWNGLNDRNWINSYQELFLFLREKVIAELASENNLCTWMQNQQQAFIEGRLDPDQKKLLGLLKGWTWE